MISPRRLCLKRVMRGSFLVKFASGGGQCIGQKVGGVVVSHFEADGGEAVRVWPLEQQGAGLAVHGPVVEELGQQAVLYLHDVSLGVNHRGPPFLRGAWPGLGAAA